jgi:Ca2+-transporting ATPase
MRLRNNCSVFVDEAIETTHNLGARREEKMKDEATQQWHAMEAEDACARLEVDAAVGLSEAAAKERLAQFGANELAEKGGTPAWVLFLRQFKSPLIYVLLAAAGISLFIGELKDASVIFGVLLVNAIVGFFQEGRAERSMAALKKLAAPRSRVRRGEKILAVPSRELVPGDVLILASGDRVAADARVIEAAALITLEGALTGESTGVSKKVEALGADAALADRKNMVFAGTTVAAGRGEAVVVATGMRTELGKIAALVQEAAHTMSPLQRRLQSLGRLTIVAVLGTMGAVFGLGLWRGLEVREMMMVAISQAVSAIPEGLPVAVTVALAVGMQRMAKHRAIIRKLAAVETLGSATVICTDKTGTLTKNEMSVTRIFLVDAAFEVTGVGYEPKGEFRRMGEWENGRVGGGAENVPHSTSNIQRSTAGSSESKDPSTHQLINPSLRSLLEVGALCNDAHLLAPTEKETWRIEGDPTEGALVVAAAKAGIDLKRLRHEQPREWEIPFDPIYRLMATAHRHAHLAEGLRVCVKGAPEAVLNLCREVRGADGDVSLNEAMKQKIADAQKAMASDGLRVLGFAEATVRAEELGETFESLRGKLTFLGLMGQIDPPRAEVKGAVALCRSAGIRTVMVTGDHLLTGTAIARQLGIADERSTAIDGATLNRMSDAELDAAMDDVAVFGRVAPEHKLRIVESFQRKGQVVAMTGDGVNDAPALTKADIGVAMGVTGTDVAKEASAMVITDDNFATIVNAVESGRVIFSNIRKVVYYLFSTSAAEIVALTTALVAGVALPLRAVQILWVNLVTSGALTVNLVMEGAEGDEMRRPPVKRGAHILTRATFARAALLVPVMGFGTIGLYGWALATGMNLEIEIFSADFWRALAMPREAMEAGVHARAQTMAFTVLCAFQWFNGLNARSHLRSIFQVGLFTNKFVLMGVGAAAALQVMVVHAPFMQKLFHTVPLSDWALIVAVSSSVLWADELRKLFLRRVRRVGDSR